MYKIILSLILLALVKLLANNNFHTISICSDEDYENSIHCRDNIIKKIAYLTFDDGPIGATKNILKISEEENIPATLFFIGYQIKNNPNIYEEAVNSKNITVANHTYSHASGRYQRFYSNSDKVLADIEKTNKTSKRKWLEF